MKQWIVVLGLAGLALPARAQDTLENGFQNPPAAARPRVWWHWMNGNITKEGIRLDLEWMKRIGIGGFQNFDAALFTPTVVEKRLTYMTPEWKDAFRYATTLADQLGLEMAIAGSPGWSESGGPWVKPAQAMKKLTWSETRIDGGKPFVGKLAAPPDTTGPFQNIGLVEMSLGPAAPPRRFYTDAAVVAYRLPERETPFAALQPTITSSGGQMSLETLTDGDLARYCALPKAPEGERAWVQIAFAQPQTIQAMTIATQRPPNPLAQFFPPGPPGQVLEVSDDGVQFRKVIAVPGAGVEQHTLAFPAVTGRYFRVTFETQPDPPNPLAAFGMSLPPPPKEHRITELILHTGARVHHAEEKAGFSLLADLSALPTPTAPAGTAVRKSVVVNLTRMRRPDGTLRWTPPPGRWVVLRLGYSLTGHKNGPASPEATGLEVDKLNPAHVRAYFSTYLDQYKSAVGPLMGKRGLQYVITDSWEAGVQNGTENLLPEFRRRRGYDPLPWLPVLTGKVVESAAASDRFLWDFRRTLADLVAENHYDLLTTLLRERGMGRYSESHESGRAFQGDGMEVKRTASVPMSAMWTQRAGGPAEQFGYNGDIRESASVAHLYGQNIVAAESLTADNGAWSFSPERLKPTADKELAMGLNRFVIHTSVHQPLLDKKPGLGLGPFGQWFTRNETWAEQARPWIDYLSRCSYLLQQGQFVADIAYFYGEDSNITALFSDHAPALPEGYNFDYVNADALLHRLSVRDGSLVTPTGMRYRVLVLDPRCQRQLSLPVLRQLQRLVRAGAVVVGPKPAAPTSVADDTATFAALAEQLWGRDGAGRRVGRGQVYGKQTVGAVLAQRQVTPDTSYSKPQKDTQLLFVHRRLAGGDLYFVSNRNDRRERLNATFRVQGKAAELWHPDTGARTPASYRIEGGATTVPLDLAPNESVFVVFRRPAPTPVRSLPVPKEATVATLAGPWQVTFPGVGERRLDSLLDWATFTDPAVKYFAGTATYTATVRLDPPTPGTRLWLDLGRVQNIATVTINGKPLGVLWKTPFRVEITGAVRPGENTIAVAVTNLWVNRLIGDAQPGATKTTFITMPFYRADSPLLPSGLLGPVELLRSKP